MPVEMNASDTRNKSDAKVGCRPSTAPCCDACTSLRSAAALLVRAVLALPSR